jgi:hypothetical protein
MWLIVSEMFIEAQTTAVCHCADASCLPQSFAHAVIEGRDHSIQITRAATTWRVWPRRARLAGGQLCYGQLTRRAEGPENGRAGVDNALCIHSAGGTTSKNAHVLYAAFSCQQLGLPASL